MYVFLKVEVVAAVVLAVVLGSVQINKLKCYYIQSFNHSILTTRTKKK